MEPTTPFYKKNSFWQVFAVIAVLLAIIAMLSLSIRNYVLQSNQNLKEAAYQRHIADSTKAANEAEIVALRADAELYIESKSLYIAKTPADNVAKTLKYQAGDVVYCKPDSTRVLITNLIISVSKYNYSVKYRVQTKFDDGFHELYPSEIY
jgi:uncharacterized membrane protein